ncbi:hypothetical protein [Bacteroides graminisolvens]|uniref:hypothetical protein n=1 Tax=Bacteroides graminisolvens TaxID=477666 RepID=UPI000401DA4C|nr:hypothetical protein [Bacteroides graminisolvens]
MNKKKPKAKQRDSDPAHQKTHKGKASANRKQVTPTNHPSSHIRIETKKKKAQGGKVTNPTHKSTKNLQNTPQNTASMHAHATRGTKTDTEKLKHIVNHDSRYGN